MLNMCWEPPIAVVGGWGLVPFLYDVMVQLIQQ